MYFYLNRYQLHIFIKNYEIVKLVYRLKNCFSRSLFENILGEKAEHVGVVGKNTFLVYIVYVTDLTF